MSEESINALKMALSKPAQLGNNRIDPKHSRFSLGIITVVKNKKMMIADYFNPLVTLSVQEFDSGWMSDKKYAKKGTMLLLSDNGLGCHISIRDKRIFNDKEWHDKFGYGLLHPLYNPYEKFIFDSKHIEIESDELWALGKFRGTPYLHGSPDKIEERLRKTHEKKNQNEVKNK